MLVRQPALQSLTCLLPLLPRRVLTASADSPGPSQDPATPAPVAFCAGRAHLHPASMPCYPSAKKRLANPHAPLDFPSFPRVGTTPRYLPSFNIHPNQPPLPLDVPHRRVAPDFEYRLCGTIASLRQSVRPLCTPLQKSDFARFLV